MKPTLLYKIASGLLIFFALGHSLGMLSEDEGEVKAVVAMMRSVHFDAMGSSRTVMDFYIGFGWLLTVFLLLSAVWSWQLGNLFKRETALARKLAWPLTACVTVGAIFCWTHFFIAPQVIASLAAICLWSGVILSGKSNGAN